MALSRYEQVMQQRQLLYDNYIKAGHATPFLYPWDTLPILYLFLAIYWNRQLSRKNARRFNLVTFCFILAHSLYVITHRRCLSMAGGYAIGLTLIFGVMSGFALMVVNEPRRDFIRLEWREAAPNSINNNTMSPLQGKTDGAGNVRRRKPTNSTQVQHEAGSKSSDSMYEFVWQEMPEDALHRIDWVIELVTSFRYPNWNVRIPTMPLLTVPELPSKSVSISKSLETSPQPIMEASYNSRAAHLSRRNAVLKTVFLYIIIDFVKVAMISDPYFLGQAPLDSSSDWALIGFIHRHTGLPILFLTRFSRLSLSLWGILNALILVFSYVPTFLYALMPKVLNLRKLTYSPLQDMRFFPGYLSSPFPTIPNKGLGGLWGKCWHQMFRFVFSESSKPLLRGLNIQSQSQIGRAIQLFVAFGLSGCLHSSASYTSFSVLPTKPWMPMMFFLSQAVGILLQTAMANLLIKTLGLEPPILIRQTTNCLFTLLWLYFTGPMLADDFARCGIWLFEPVPISFVRGLRGEGWWFWGGQYFDVWYGDGSSMAFWHKGLAIV